MGLDVSLRALLELAAEARGLKRKAYIKMIREYIERTPIEWVIKQLDEIKDWRLLRLVWAAKPIKPIYDYILKRLEKEMKV